MGERICSIDGCGGAHQSRGWCGKHYARWLRHGDPHYTERPLWFQPAEERFFAKVDAEGDCWVWTAFINECGYGQFGDGETAHLWLWRHLVGPVPAGLELDHLCRNRVCVNPDHLQPVPKRVNWLRGFNPMAKNARKTHCPRGHAYDGANVLIYTRPSGQTSRYCRACAKERKRHDGRMAAAG